MREELKIDENLPMEKWCVCVCVFFFSFSISTGVLRTNSVINN